MDAVSWIEDGVLGDHHPSVCPVLGLFARLMNDALKLEARQKLRKYILLLARTADAESTTLRFAYLVKLITRFKHPVCARLPYIGARLFRADMANMQGNLPYTESIVLLAFFNLNDRWLFREFDRLIAIGKPSQPWTEQHFSHAVQQFAAEIAQAPN